MDPEFPTQGLGLTPHRLPEQSWPSLEEGLNTHVFKFFL